LSQSFPSEENIIFIYPLCLPEGGEMDPTEAMLPVEAFRGMGTP